jgi:hypothetical protein
MTTIDEQRRIDVRALITDTRKTDELHVLTTDEITTDDLDKVSGGGSYGYTRYGYRYVPW